MLAASWTGSIPDVDLITEITPVPDSCRLHDINLSLRTVLFGPYPLVELGPQAEVQMEQLEQELRVPAC